MLAQEYGAAVLFLTANPASLGEGIDGTIGCISKPVDEVQVEHALDFLVDFLSGKAVTPPSALRVFPKSSGQAGDSAANMF